MRGSPIESLTTEPGVAHASAWDRTGVIASIGCAIHCMVAPVLLILAPTLGGWWVHPATHLLIAALVLPVAASALWHGFGAHAQRWILVVGGIGMALVFVGVVLPYVAPSAAGADGVCRDCCPTLQKDAVTGATSLRIPPASIVTMLGGLALITAHIGNIRLAGRCCSAEHDSETKTAS